MDRVVSYEQIQIFVNQIRSLKRGFVTNFYWDERKHPYWLVEGSLIYDSKNDSVVLLHIDDGFSNVFYISTCLEDAAKHIQCLEHDKDEVLDLVIKDDDEKQLEPFINTGFVEYKHLLRMSHVGLYDTSSWHPDEAISARKGDVPFLMKTLSVGFDPLAEQLPSEKELSDSVRRGEVLVIKDGEIICGFIIFEITGKTWHLRYWYTSPNYRNRSVGANLLKAALIAGKDTKRQILWVMSHNDNAIKRYEHYGFKKELLNDYIMIKRNKYERENY